ncbi:MAG: 3-phosphoshikimate 1-carboxyvinyltransferase, partial [Candidatus Freyarchaeota archaeon]|nr:3-phosphoshikimate 1-carboxyvinyltransferase [Candidatus Jordarchaeia archaeon]
DLLPVVSVLGAFAEGETRIFNAEHVRFKESDRISVMAEELSKMGVDVEEREDGLIVRGGRVMGGVVDAHGDHRVFMALTVAGLAAEGETIISGDESVGVSYPSFLEDLAKLGASFRRV